MFEKIFSLDKKIFSWLRGRTFNRFLFTLLAILGLALFFLLFWYVDFDEVIRVISLVRGWRLIVVLSLIFVVLGIASWRWQLILAGYGYKKSLVKLLGLVFRAAAISLIFPSFEVSGETYKAISLRKFGVSNPAAFASVFFDYFMVLLVNIVLGLGLIVYIILVGFRFSSLIPLISGAVILVIMLVLVLRKFFQRGWFSELMIRRLCSINPVVCYTDEKTLEDIKLFDYGVSFFLKESRSYLIKALGVSLLGFLWELGQIWLILTFLGREADFLMVSWFYLVINFFNSVPVFGGVGFGEAGAFLAGASLGVSDSVALSLVLLLRLRQLMIILVGGWLFIQDSLRFFLGSTSGEINKEKVEGFNQDL